MATITLELPDTLTEQLEKQRIDHREIEAVVLHALELWLVYREELPVSGKDRNKRFTESAVPFIRDLIRQNQELFAMLAEW